MKNDKLRFLLCMLFFGVLALLTFRCTWPADHVFAASDANIGRLALAKNSLPASFLGSYTGNQLLGNSGSAINLFRVLLAICPLTFFANAFYGLVLVAGSMSFVWFLRLWGRSWTASVFGALIAFWFNSIMLAAGGHPYKMEVLALSVLSLCFIEKAVRTDLIWKKVGFSVFCGLSVGIMLVEQQDVALLAGLFVGAYAVFRLFQRAGTRFTEWVALLGTIGAVALLLAGSAMLKSYQSNITKASAVQGDPSAKWNYITQWSMVPGEWPDLIASGWSGWGSGNPDGPYWGKIGQAAEWESSKKGFRNFKITSIYLGIIPFLFGGFGLAISIRNRRREGGAVGLFWCVAGLLGLWLAFGKYSILYKVFYHLPLVNNIRVPMKFLDNFQICLGIVAAFGLDWVIAEGRRAKAVKIFSISCAVISGLLLLAGLKLLVAPSGQINEFTAMGFGQYAKVMVRNMSNAWFHATLLALICAGLMFYVWKSVKPAWWAAIALIGVLSADSLLLTSHYFKAVNIASMKKGNILINYLKEHQGNDRAFFVDQNGIYNQWLASDGPYHGLNLFNIWQMPRMPVEYKNFLSTVGRNQVRLWQLSSVKYVAAPAQVVQQLNRNPELAKQFQPVLNYQVPTQQGMRKDELLEFTGTIPRCSLFYNWESVPLDAQCDRLTSSSHNVRTTVLVDSAHHLDSKSGESNYKGLNAKLSDRRLVVSVNTEDPAIVRFSQFYQPHWKVFVDGNQAELMRVDYLCMGVFVAPGKHVVEFRCSGGEGRAAFMSGVLVISLMTGSFLVRTRHRGCRE